LSPRDFRPDRSGAVVAEIVGIVPATTLFTSSFREIEGFVWSKLSDEAPATTDFVGHYR
jgi:hypothetical protein